MIKIPNIYQNKYDIKMFESNTFRPFKIAFFAGSVKDTVVQPIVYTKPVMRYSCNSFTSNNLLNNEKSMFVDELKIKRSVYK